MSTQRLIVLALVAALVAFLFLKRRGDMSVDEAKRLVKAGAVLVDVRTPAEFSGGHIDGALNIPLQDLARRAEELSKEDELVLYCASGNRSGQALLLLRERGFQKVHNLGAMSRW